MNKKQQGKLHWSLTIRFAAGIVLAAASAGLLTLAMPPFGVWPLAILGIIPMIFAQYRLFPDKLSALSPAIAIGGLVALYIMPAFLGLPGAPWYMRGLPLVFAGIIFLTDQGTATFHKRTHFRWYVISGAVGWVGIELIRSFIPVLGTWGFLGYAYFKQPWLIQPVSIFGIYGLDLVSLFLGLGLGLGVLAWFDQRWSFDQENVFVSTQQAKKTLIWSSSLFTGWVFLSLILFIPSTRTTSFIRVAAIQPGFKMLWTDAELKSNTLTKVRFDKIYNQMFEILLTQTREAAKKSPDLVVWPEGALKFDPQTLLPQTFQTLAAETSADLVIPYFVGTRNEVTVINPEGGFLGVYGKDHPVIFVNEASSTGGTYPVYETGFGTLGTIICYDLDFTDTARKIARNGAQVIAVPSGDFPGITDKHYAHVVFRAVENRVAMIKTDRSYDSAIIDPYGRIVEKIVSNEPIKTTLIADVPVVKTRPLQTILGDWIGWITLAGLAFFTVFEIMEKKKGSGV